MTHLTAGAVEIHLLLIASLLRLRTLVQAEWTFLDQSCWPNFGIFRRKEICSAKPSTMAIARRLGCVASVLRFSMYKYPHKVIKGLISQVGEVTLNGFFKFGCIYVSGCIRNMWLISDSFWFFPEYVLTDGQSYSWSTDWLFSSFPPGFEVTRRSGS